MPTLVSAAALLAVSALPLGRVALATWPTPSEETVTKFKAFAKAAGKDYSEEAFVERLGVFEHNLAFIEEFNRRSPLGSVRLGVNQFADLTSDEFRQAYLPGLTKRLRDSPVDDSLNGAMDVPSSIDWRSHGAVTPVKDQKNCGSCWAFSATGAIEGAIFIAEGSLVGLSEEELVDCSGGKDRGCSGGEPAAAFDWVVKNGICSETSYPYSAFQDECHNQFNPCTPVARISGYQAVPASNELALKAAVARQPISVEIEADTDVFRFYKSGILSGDGCGEALDHAVLAVGFGTENGQDYWLVKNSWNSTWGDAGYVKIARTESAASDGECGIARNPSFPVAAGASPSLVV